MDKIQLQPNVPVELALQFPDGKEVSSQFGTNQVMFTTVDGRVLYLAPYAAAKIRDLHLKPGQLCRLTKAEVMHGSKKAVEWRAEIVEHLGEQGDGTFAIAKPPDTPPPNGKPKPGSNGAPLPASPYEHSGSSLYLREIVNMLIDVEASCIEYAKKYSGAIGNQDVRALLLSVYINQTKGTRL